MNNLLTICAIFLVSLALGLIKYGSLADQYKNKSWQLKFIEMWNDFVNFFVGGLIGYYIILIRWPLLIKTGVLNTGDIFLITILLISLFGHLCVLSNNITEGIKAIIDKFFRG